MSIRRSALQVRHMGRQRVRHTVGPRPDSDGGLTVVELLVTAMIGSVVLAGVATVMVSIASNSRETSVHTANSRAVRGAAEVVAAALRVGIRPSGEASAVVEVSLYTLINRTGASATTTLPPTLTRYWWDATTFCLNQSRVTGVALTNPPASGPFYSWTGTADVRCVMKTATAPTFKYYTTSAISAGGTVLPDMGAPAAGLTATERAQVRSVQVLLTARDPVNASVAPSVVLDRVTLSNS
jgi:type II secretory pathway pseudopilin PulG